MHKIAQARAPLISVLVICWQLCRCADSGTLKAQLCRLLALRLTLHTPSTLLSQSPCRLSWDKVSAAHSVPPKLTVAQVHHKAPHRAHFTGQDHQLTSRKSAQSTHRAAVLQKIGGKGEKHMFQVLEKQDKRCRAGLLDLLDEHAIPCSRPRYSWCCPWRLTCSSCSLLAAVPGTATPSSCSLSPNKDIL